MPQAIHFSNLVAARGLSAPIVIHLNVEDCALVQRLTTQRQCPQCKHIYNLLTQPPKLAGVCDTDGAELLKRNDDCEQVIRQRLRAYRELTGPVLGEF